MKTKKIEKYSAEYWRELDKEQRMTDKLDREHYERPSHRQARLHDGRR